jgi:hypothetical protein
MLALNLQHMDFGELYVNERVPFSSHNSNALADRSDFFPDAVLRGHVLLTHARIFFILRSMLEGQGATKPSSECLM